MTEPAFNDYFSRLVPPKPGIVRVARVADLLLEKQNAEHGLEASHRSMAAASAGGEGPAALAAHSPQRGAEHGLRGRAGELGEPGSATRPPTHATRYLETARDRLSYADLAPLLAARVLEVEQETRPPAPVRDLGRVL